MLANNQQSLTCASESPSVILVMGVSCSGKTTIAEKLSNRLGVSFVDADDFHSTKNRSKMSSGIPLTDEDRLPWLNALISHLQSHESAVVLACSALKRRYRDMFRMFTDRLAVVHLIVGKEELERRLVERSRKGLHFMPPGMTESQLRDLEAPQADEGVLEIYAEKDTEEIVDNILKYLKL